MKTNEIPDFAAGRLGDGPKKPSGTRSGRSKSEYNTGRLGLILSPEVEDESEPTRPSDPAAPAERQAGNAAAPSAPPTPPVVSFPPGRAGGSSFLDKLRSQVRQRPVVWAIAAGSILVVTVACVILILSGNGAMGPQSAVASAGAQPGGSVSPARRATTPKPGLPRNKNGDGHGPDRGRTPRPGGSMPVVIPTNKGLRRPGRAAVTPPKPTTLKHPAGRQGKPKPSAGPPHGTAVARPKTQPPWRPIRPKTRPKQGPAKLVTAQKLPASTAKPARPTGTRPSRPRPRRAVRYRPTPPDIHLTAIFVRTNGSFCTINGRFVRVGQTVEKCKVIAIYRRFVEMEKNGQRFLLRFRLQLPPEPDPEEEDEEEGASDESDDEEEDERDEDKDRKRKKRKKKSKK